MNNKKGKSATALPPFQRVVVIGDITTTSQLITGAPGTLAVTAVAPK